MAYLVCFPVSFELSGSLQVLVNIVSPFIANSDGSSTKPSMLYLQTEASCLHNNVYIKIGSKKVGI